ncbi:MAG: hypothetical protein LBL38_01635 [Lactobacillales bacterium]|nr:hypothetical protein [Lactobacillales bacterium]
MPVTINDIKKKLECRVGSPIQVVAQAGRKRQIRRKGVLSEVYPSLFIINLDQEENNYERVSFSYSDILTKVVEVNFLNDLLTL